MTGRKTSDIAAGGEVPLSYVRLLFEYLQSLDIDSEQLLGEKAPEICGRHSGRFPLRRWRELLEIAAAHLGDPDLGLSLGQRISPRHFGLMGYVLLACGNLGAALMRLHQYQRLVYDVSPMQMHSDTHRITLQWGTEAGRPGRLVDETAITALVQFARDISGTRISIEQVHFVNAPPRNKQPYKDYFGCDVTFEQEATQVSISLSDLGLPLRQPDPALLAMLEQQAQMLLGALPVSGDLEQAVRQAVSALSREGSVTLERVAQRLKLSPRTLHRRLEPCAQNFRVFRDDTLRRLAEDYLLTPGISIAEVSLLLGYSEQSAFTRAFSRWTGQSPRRFQIAISEK